MHFIFLQISNYQQLLFKVAGLETELLMRLMDTKVKETIKLVASFSFWGCQTQALEHFY